ncbi:hypothetical protein ST201phi2-1p385 [Pseudomonas phage 201phi2-1]|uniref:Uncharacterized protein n=1 Tax=Pseudomonas phage 201phi2-1 TaxID=198110 RepID=B3FJP5_BP201|nr:hypothetical protein ST201phi2-1p385 [Pseudomonas phage 201phi2-1]ABY63210.1 hypothetical protein 201phi2-1p385 [Pseudomonas phage 201phi2-1]
MFNIENREQVTDSVIADVLEYALVVGAYDPLMGRKFMCSALSQLWCDNVISSTVRLACVKVVLSAIQGDITVATYLLKNNMIDYNTFACKVSRHMETCRHYWRLIRKLRGQPALEI